jgi:hypothetical protein
MPRRPGTGLRNAGPRQPEASFWLLSRELPRSWNLECRRFVFPNQYPYSLVYRLTQPVELVAVAHQKRRPAPTVLGGDPLPRGGRGSLRLQHLCLWKHPSAGAR